MHGLETSPQNRQQHQHHHHHHHHHYNLTSSQHHLLLTPPKTKTTSLNLQQTSIAMGGKEKSQPLCGSTRQNSKTNSSISNRTYLPPMRLEYQQPYYVAEPYVTDSIVYADLALAANGRREPHLLPHYRAPQNSTEYAILKFHDVGQEIDVWKGWYRHISIQCSIEYVMYSDRFTSCVQEYKFLVW